MHYTNRFNQRNYVKCNWCDNRTTFSNAGLYQYKVEKKHFDWTISDRNEKLCPSCSGKLQKGVDRVLFNIITTEGFDDKELLTNTLQALKKTGTSFLTDVRNSNVFEVAKEIGVAISSTSNNSMKEDVTLVFYHELDDITRFFELETQTYLYKSTKERKSNPYIEHFQNIQQTQEDQIESQQNEQLVNESYTNDSNSQTNETLDTQEEAPVGESETQAE